MKNDFSLLFYLKKPKNYESGLVPIHMRIAVNSRRAETTSGRDCDPSAWNNIAGRLKGTKEEVRSFNAYLDNLQAQVYEAHDLLTTAGYKISADSLKIDF